MVALLYVQRAYRFANTAESVGLARRAVRATLLAWEFGQEVIEPSLVILSELATNAVMHAKTSPTFEVASLVQNSRMILAVADHDPRPPVKRHPADDADQGRGLVLIEALSDGWACAPRMTGKIVFARLHVGEPPLHVYLREQTSGDTAIQSNPYPEQPGWLAVIDSLAYRADSYGSEDSNTSGAEPIWHR